MDFSYSEEQQMLLDSARRFLQKDYSFETRRAIMQRSESAHDAAVWQGLADLGLLALNVPEEHGGMAGSALDTSLAMQAAGEALLLEPFMASGVLATRLIATAAVEEVQAVLLPMMSAGAQIAVPAHEEPGTRFDWLDISTRAQSTANGFRISGHKSVVAHAAHADLLLVSAKLDDGKLAVFAIPTVSSGLRLNSYRTVDGVAASEVWLDQVEVPAQARLSEDDASAALAEMQDWGLMCVCAEAVGAMDKLLAATVEYTRTRKQFGQPIARFQALQHRMADMLMHIEQARSMASLCAVRVTEPDLQARRHALSSAKVVVGQACRFVAQQAVQLHGGMGVTDELDVGHYFKRLMAIELQFGATDTHLENVAAAMMQEEAAKD